MHDTKLNAIRDPRPCFDALRHGFFVPQRDSCANIAQAICDQAGESVAFMNVAATLVGLSDMPSGEPIAPNGFDTDAFEAYLAAMATPGHAYYLSCDELLAVAEAVRANVVIAERVDDIYRVVGHTLTGAGPIAIVARTSCFGREVSFKHNDGLNG